MTRIRMTNEERNTVLVNLKNFLTCIHASEDEIDEIINAGATPIYAQLMRHIGAVPEFKDERLTVHTFNRGLLSLIAYKFGMRKEDK